MLYAHGPDLCRESDLRHAMANCFEALIGEIPLRHRWKLSRWWCLEIRKELDMLNQFVKEQIYIFRKQANSVSTSINTTQKLVLGGINALINF